jgi:2,3-bisphosphoglycerate-independent phosphoglycerate mutase
VSLAATPNLDRILATWPRTSLACSGRAVGLPDGFMGNSEVGHMNIGAGRTVYQDMTRIDMAVEDGSLARNPALTRLFDRVRAAGGRLHLMGLLSDGGVHSHVRHLHALIEAARDAGVECFVHAFLDGRDTAPTGGKAYVAGLVAAMGRIGWGRIATLCGRYYAMDRDKRWERNALAYALLTSGEGATCLDPVAAVQASYDAGENDEFVKPRVVVEHGAPVGLVRDGDGIFFFNFRADRARQICRPFFEEDFDKFERKIVPQLSGFATMTEYESTFPMDVAFARQSLDQTLGQVVSEAGLAQLRIAETEKYAHVTYFFNCGREEPFAGEERVLVPSPREVATYDLKPEMSADEVCARLLEQWKTGRFALGVCNFANPDMVGHTGVIEATVKAVQAVDACVGRVAEAVLGAGGRILLTADHGNAEEMLDAHGAPQTSHSRNPVPLVLLDPARPDVRLAKGRLGDIGPTILDLWGRDTGKPAKPEAMTGRSLLED